QCLSGPTPVVIVAAHTGVTDGNDATQSLTYTPCSTIRCSAGARPTAIARSSIAGLSASMTTRTSFLGRVNAGSEGRRISGLHVGVPRAGATGAAPRPRDRPV